MGTLVPVADVSYAIYGGLSSFIPIGRWNSVSHRPGRHLSCRQIRDEKQLSDMLQDSAPPQGRLTRIDDPVEWVRETRIIAMRKVYSPRVLAVVEAAEGNASGKPEPVELSSEYIAESKDLMNWRAKMAGARLARVLAADLDLQ